MLFSISGILKVAAHNFMKSRSHDGLAAKGLLSQQNQIRVLNERKDLLEFIDLEPLMICSSRNIDKITFFICSLKFDILIQF